MITLSIDAMGGDFGLDATVPAALDIIDRHPQIGLILVGDARRIEARLAAAGARRRRRLEVVNAEQVVGMDEAPATALRKKKNSSMRVAINLVKDGRADACVSSGNTGALLATARFVLKTIPGIDRPAICASLPRMDGHTYVLDLGANVDSPPAILLQFGLMGSLLINCLEGVANPSVGLLNIGVEDIKGNDTIKAAAQLFKRSSLNYVGYIEANDIYAGNTDLVVCDGFVGNVALKATEGAAQMIMGAIGEEFTRNAATRGAGLLAKPVLASIRRRLDHRRYNGASLLGLKGSVVKSHGAADATGFRYAVEVGIKEVNKNLVSNIENALTDLPDSDTLPA
ncbi:MAG: phosphate acyltransferase PlsX [Gammaproteobacteria bacterium]|nr:phosphate acyltransferase PlsX [Gammaproteobacteria bacterium]